jgi:hypothetical protein
MEEAMPHLYNAEPCDSSDPAPGARLIRAGEVLGRLSPDEVRALAAGLLAAVGEQVVYLSAADIADHFGDIEAKTVHTWRARYGPDRSPEAIAKAPTCPQPDMYLGRRKPQAGWREDRLPEWDAWRASLPGSGAGGGRPRNV